MEPSVVNHCEEMFLEKEAMKSERKWIFLNEIPFTCQEMKAIIEHCLEIINVNALQRKIQQSSFSESGVRSSGKDSEIQSTTITCKPCSEPSLFSSMGHVQDGYPIVFESSDGILKGMLRIEGWNIVEAEFNIKSKWNKQIPFKTTISPIHPLKLYQLHNCYNFLRLSLDYVVQLESIHHSENFDLLCDVDRVIEKLTQTLRQALDELLLPIEHLFPESPLGTSMVFQPQLPQDLVIECSIVNGELSISMFCLHILNQPLAKSKKNGEHSQRTEQQVLQYTRNNVTNWVEIVDQAQVSCSTITKLNNTCSLIELAMRLCADLRDKVNLFL